MLIMIFVFIITFVILTILEIRDLKNTYFSHERVIEDFMVITFASIAAGIILGYFISVPVGLCLPTEDVFIVKKDLYAVDDGNSISGRFYLMGGYIKDEPVVRYIIDGKYGKQIKTVPGYQAYIIEGYSNPKLEIYESDFKEEWYKWIAFVPKKRIKIFVLRSEK